MNLVWNQALEAARYAQCLGYAMVTQAYQAHKALGDEAQFLYPGV